MNKVVLILTLAIIAVSLKTRDPSHLRNQPWHLLNGELCKKQGGFVCGFIDKDCCEVGCDSFLLGLKETCVGDKKL